MHLPPAFSVLAILVLMATNAPLTGANEGDSIFIVGVEGSAEAIAAGLSGAAVVAKWPALRLVAIRAESEQSIRTNLAASGWQVRFVEPERYDVASSSSYPDDPLWNSQYGPKQVNADDVWNRTKGGSTKSLCVVGSGIRTTHEDLAGSRFLGGYDFVNNDDVPNDLTGHETFATSIAAANTDNSKGMVAVAPNVTFYTPKVTEDGTAGGVSLTAGFDSCFANSTAIFSYSYSALNSYSQARADQLLSLWENDSLIYSTTGNDGDAAACDDGECVGFPGNLSTVVAVGMTDATGAVHSSSSVGNDTELVAPGYLVLGALRGADFLYATDSGTSFAAPNVAAVAALVWEVEPSMPNSVVRDLLAETATDIGATGRDTISGFGVVNAEAAVNAVHPRTLPGCRYYSPNRFNDLAATSPIISGTVTFKGWAYSAFNSLSTVELIVDSTAYSMSASSPSNVYAYSFDTTALSDGLHTFTLKCTESDSSVRTHARTYNIDN